MPKTHPAPLVPFLSLCVFGCPRASLPPSLPACVRACVGALNRFPVSKKNLIMATSEGPEEVKGNGGSYFPITAIQVRKKKKKLLLLL